MPRYRYTGTDVAGRRISGEREAPNPDALLAALGNEVLFIDSIQPVEFPERERQIERLIGEMGDHEAAELGGQLAEIIECELPLESGLQAIAAETSSPRMRKTFQDLSQRLSAGVDLATALEECRAPAELRALVLAGARSGNTGKVLEHYATNAQGVVSVRQSILLGLFYPATLLVVMTLIGAGLVYWVIPGFESVFLDFDLQLPWITVAMLGIATFFRSIYPWIGLAVFFIGMLLVRLLLVEVLGTVGYRRFVCRVPLIGPMRRWVAMARFSQMLSLLVENDVPLDESLALAGDASGDPEIQFDCQKILKGLRSGETLQEAAGRIANFPPSFLQALSWERRSTGMADVLQSIGDMYAGRVRAAAAVLVAFLPPILLMFLGGTMLFLVIAMFMPLFELLNRLA
jgi:general secretion pathway protein F